MNRKQIFKFSGGTFLALGIVAAFIICGLIVWGDVEATLFTNGINGDRRISSLKCPVLITPHETGTISVVVKNPADKDSDRYLTATISEGFTSLVRESKEKVPIPANGKEKVEWKIYPEDAAFERIVLFRLFIPSKYPYPSMSGSCGVIKIDFPWLNGNQVLLGVSALSAGFLIIGALMFERGIHPESGALSVKTRARTNGIYFLAAVLVVSAFLSYIGLWLIGLLGLAAAVILAGVIVLRC